MHRCLQGVGKNAVKNVFPDAKQRECFRHLMGNAVKKFDGENFPACGPAAKAHEQSTYDYHMNL